MLVGVLIFFVSVGCQQAVDPKKEFIENNKPQSPLEYHLFAWTDEDESTTVTLVNDAIVTTESSPAQVHVYDIAKEGGKEARALGIKKYPAFVVIDSEGIVVQTSDVSELKKSILMMIQKMNNNRK